MTTDITRTALDVLDEYTDDMPGIVLEPGKLQWQHGADAGKLKMPGVFFGKETAFTEPPPPPWESDDRFIEDDGPGFSVPRLRIAIVGWREQWFIPGEKPKDKVHWLLNGQMAPKGTKVKKLVEYLILVDGLADPMVLGVSGLYKSKPFENIVRSHERGALSQLIRQRKRNVPRWAHWLTIGGKVDRQGKPVLEKATNAAGEEYGSIVTPPALLAQPDMVSADVMRQGIDTWNLYNSLGWFKYQRVNRSDVVEATYTVESRPALPPAGRNVPQPIEEDADGDPIPF